MPKILPYGPFSNRFGRKPATYVIIESLPTHKTSILPLFFLGLGLLMLYPNNLKNWNFGCAKTPGLIDRKPTSVDFSQLSDNPSKTHHWRLFAERCHISNIGSFTIDQSREFSRQPKSNSSGCLGIVVRLAFLHPHRLEG